MGRLFLVATPIGNLGDISLRALETLREVDYVAAEDTRKTGRLLKHFDIQNTLLAFHEHNERKATPGILKLLDQGNTVALVTNAGTPGISDPGFTLVRAVLSANDEGASHEILAIPGAVAMIPALILSGLPVHSFTFRGFPPRKKGARTRFLETDAEIPHTLIYYESPYRLLAFLQCALEVFGDRPAAVANDLTKLHESMWRGRLSAIVSELELTTLRGEFVVVIAGADAE